jgi:hypothetical protein
MALFTVRPDRTNTFSVSSDSKPDCVVITFELPQVTGPAHAIGGFLRSAVDVDRVVKQVKYDIDQAAIAAKKILGESLASS